jgi:hypothetical protein
MRSRMLAPVLLAALLGPASAVEGAGSTAVLHIEAATVRSEGLSLMAAELLVLLQESLDGPPTPPGFQLDAASVVVETTTRETSVHPPGASVGLDPKTSSREHRDVAFTGLRARPDDRFDVFALPRHPAPQLRAETGCSTWTVPAEGKVSREPRVPTQTDRNAVMDVASGAEVADCDGSRTWTIEGDFLVLLWERDVEVRGRDGSRETLESGRLAPKATHGSGGGTDGLVSQDQEIYLYVADGRLEIQLDARAKAWVAPGSSLEGSSALVFQGATVAVAGGELTADRVRLEGDLGFTLQPTGRRLAAAVTGVEDARADGQEIAPAALPPVEPAASTPWAMWGLAAAGLGAVALAALRVRRRHADDA